MLDNEGKEVPGTRGYKYFGAAKDLPGVRELFEPDIGGAPRKTRGELMKDVDADYYGYRDDDDGILEPLEKEAEKVSILALEEAWKKKMEEYRIRKGKSASDDMEVDPADDDDVDETETPAAPVIQVKNYLVEVPSQEEIEQKILDLKKKRLLEQYLSEDLTSKETEAKELMGIKS